MIRRATYDQGRQDRHWTLISERNGDERFHAIVSDGGLSLSEASITGRKFSIDRCNDNTHPFASVFDALPALGKEARPIFRLRSHSLRPISRDDTGRHFRKRSIGFSCTLYFRGCPQAGRLTIRNVRARCHGSDAIQIIQIASTTI
jgi:hypothetical protein